MSEVRYDAIVLGGALAGASLALRLLERRPGSRVLIVERCASFERRVGEATVEISALFLSKVLGLDEHLEQVPC